jgi:hypothetical protein
MNPTLLVAIIICFLLGIVLNGVITYVDIKRFCESQPGLGHDYRCDRFLCFLYGISHIGLSIAGVVLTVFVYLLEREALSEKEASRRLDVVMVCNVALHAGGNVRRRVYISRHC